MLYSRVKRYIAVLLAMAIIVSACLNGSSIYAFDGENTESSEEKTSEDMSSYEGENSEDGEESRSENSKDAESSEEEETEEPEVTEDKAAVTKVSGSIEMNHVSFRYDENTPWVLEDLSLKIHAGEYVAIVGRTGCGKSTLMRLLLGFEKPEKGAIYYDGKDIESLDLGSLRRRIGTVMQQSGLFQGDIYSNIVLTAPGLSIDEAWDAAEKAGIADDIRAMPMGMYTMVSEGGGGISGGQKQRLMIARAIAPKPKLLFFDEATSALDNKTQKQVSEALDAMGCTRVVIAHRLSTIRHCDRILVLDGGTIVEDGSYDALIEKGGFFADLVARQRVDAEA